MYHKELEQLIATSLFDKMDSAKISEEIDKMRKYKDLEKRYADKIKHRKDGRQVYVLIDRKQIAAKDMDALYDKLYELEYGLESYSMEDIFPKWLIWKRDNTNVAGSTLRNYTYDWNKYFDGREITQRPIKELSSKDFTALFRSWTKDRELTQKAFNSLKSLINGMYSYAINELQTVSVNPIREIDMRQFAMKPVKAGEKKKVFTIEDRELLLKHLRENPETGINELYSLAIQFDFHVTMRIGELIALKW